MFDAETTEENTALAFNAAIGVGAGAGLGGGAYDDATSTLALPGTVVILNQAEGPTGIGGGVYALGTFTADGSTVITHNHASSGGDDIGPRRPAEPIAPQAVVPRGAIEVGGTTTTPSDRNPSTRRVAGGIVAGDLGGRLSPRCPPRPTRATLDSPGGIERASVRQAEADQFEQASADPTGAGDTWLSGRRRMSSPPSQRTARLLFS